MNWRFLFKSQNCIGHLFSGYGPSALNAGTTVKQENKLRSGHIFGVWIDGARSYHDGLREGGGGTDSPACYGGGGKRNAGNLGPEEKIDSIQLEYTYLLTSQLESQRRYFEEKLARVEENASRELDEVLTR